MAGDAPGRLRLRRRMDGWFGRRCADTFAAEEVGILASWGVVEMADGKPAWPGDGTLEALWEARGSTVLESGAGDEFDRWRRIRRALCVPPGPASDAVLRRVIELGGGGVTETRAVHLLGFKVARLSMARLRELDGAKRKRAAPVSRGDFEDLVAILPEAAREPVLAAFRREVLPPITPPLATHVGRVVALRGRPARVLGACRLVMSSLNRRTPAAAYCALARIERFDAVTAAGDQRCAAHVTAALEEYVAGGSRPEDPERARLLAASLMGSDVRAARDWAVSTLGDAAEDVVRALPAVHSDATAFEAQMRRRIRSGDEARTNGKVGRIVAMVPKLTDLLVAVENRTAFVEDATARFLESLPKARESTSGGVSAGFECTGPVLRPDGSLGEGEQTVFWEIVREDELVRRALLEYPGDASSAAVGAIVRCEPAHAARLHVVYLGTAPETEGGEHHEPWLIELFRCGAIGSGAGLSGELRRRRRGLLAGMGSPNGIVAPLGLLGADRREQGVAARLRPSDPEGRRVVVPLLEFLHAMLLARMVFLMGVRWGARLGETRQLRSGCVRTEHVDGRPELVASLKPKGWNGEGLFGLDEDTAKGLVQLKLIAHHRWFPDCFDEKGDPSVPVAAFRNGARNDLAPARYLLRGPRGTVRPEHLLRFLHVLLQGVVLLDSHDGRYLFATALGLRGEDYGSIGGCLHHSPVSAMPRRYDLSRHLRTLVGAAAFNADLDARQIGRVRDDRS